MRTEERRREGCREERGRNGDNNVLIGIRMRASDSAGTPTHVTPGGKRGRNDTVFRYDRHRTARTHRPCALNPIEAVFSLPAGKKADRTRKLLRPHPSLSIPLPIMQRRAVLEVSLAVPELLFLQSPLSDLIPLHSSPAAMVSTGLAQPDEETLLLRRR